MNAPRAEWLHRLTAHPAAVLIETARQLARDWTLTHVELPQAGLGMLKLADGAFGEPYYLGEFPLARAHVRLELPDGREAHGAAQLLGDDAALVAALAVLDAVLAAQLPGWETATALLDQGGQRRAEERRARRAMLGATRVDFATLGSGTEDDDDDG